MIAVVSGHNERPGPGAAKDRSVASEYHQARAVIDIPDAERFVARAGDGALAIGRHRHGHYRARVTF